MTEQAAALSTAVAEATAALPDPRQTEVRAAAGVQRLTQADLEAEDKQVATASRPRPATVRPVATSRESAPRRRGESDHGRPSGRGPTLTAQRAGEDAAMEKAQARLGEANRAAEATEREIAAVTETIATTDARAAALNRQVEQANRRQPGRSGQQTWAGSTPRWRPRRTRRPTAPPQNAVRDTAAAAEAAQTALDAASGGRATAETAEIAAAKPYARRARRSAN